MSIVNGVTTVYLGDYYEYEVGTGIVRSYYGSGAAMRIANAPNPEENGVFYLLRDHHGSTNLTIDSAGNVVGEMRYKAWGETCFTSGTTPTAFAYTGQRQEPSLGFYYYKARWYDPALGRFMQADTIVPEAGNPMALDRYGYVVNNPVKLLDPSGHCWGVLKFIRGIPTYETNCNNIDMARLIVKHDDTTSGQKAGAVAYMFWEGISHAGLVVGLAGLACSTVAGCAAAAEKALGIGTVACADGDCMNEARAVNDIINTACADGNCTNEFNEVLKIGQQYRIPSEIIRFTQDSISWATKKGVPLDTLTNEISNGYFRGSIRVVEYAGNLWTLDNRRLAAFKLLGYDVPVTIVSLNDPAIYNEFVEKFTTITDGLSILVKGTGIIIQ